MRRCGEGRRVRGSVNQLAGARRTWLRKVETEGLMGAGSHRRTRTASEAGEFEPPSTGCVEPTLPLIKSAFGAIFAIFKQAQPLCRR
jgi:hypothetical protein